MAVLRRKNFLSMIKKFIYRLSGRIIRELGQKGLYSKVRYFGHLETLDSKNNKKRLLIVAPGAVQIPSNGWGAVETVIWESLETYKHNFEIWILNSRHKKEWNKASNIEFDVILSHSDVDCKKIRSIWPSTPLVGVSHYGYGAFPQLWDKGFAKILADMAACDFIVCLSEEIRSTFSEYLPAQKLIVSSNGTSFQPKISSNLNGPILCLGKIETRKRQYELFEATRGTEIKIVFAGPIVDNRVIQLLKESPEYENQFIGPLSRMNLEEDFQNYSALILVSNGEADALVLYEAQMAGLSILVTSASLGAQDLSLEWIHLITERFNSMEILSALKSNTPSPEEIAEYSRRNYPWEIRNSRLVRLLVDLSNKQHLDWSKS